MEIYTRDVRKFYKDHASGKVVTAWHDITRTPYEIKNRDKVTRRSSENDRLSDFNDAKSAGRILFRDHFVDRDYEKIYPIDVVAKSRNREYGTDWKLQNLHLGEHVRVSYPDWPEFVHKYDLGELTTLAFAKANQRELDVLTSLAELPETIELFLDVAKALVKPRQAAKAFFSRYRKVAKKKNKFVRRQNLPSQAIEDLNNAWLQYRYGIMPAYYLIRDIHSQFNRHVDAWETTRVSDRFVKDFSVRDKIVLEPGGCSANVLIEVHAEEELKVLLKRGYSKRDLQQKRFGFNPVQTAWELTPYSFVVDWAVQVGDYINAYTPTCASEEAWLTVSKSKLRSTYTIVGYTSETGEYDLSGTTGLVRERIAETYKREVGRGDPKFELPVGLSLNLKRAGDSFALSWPKVRKLLTR